MGSFREYCQYRDTTQTEGLMSTISDGWSNFRSWLGQLKQHSANTWRIISGLVNHAKTQSPELLNCIKDLPAALRDVAGDPVVKKTFLDKSVIAGLRQAAANKRLSKDTLLSDLTRLDKVLDRVGTEGEAAEAFLRSSGAQFANFLWGMSHLGPILSKVPNVTVLNAKAVWDEYQKGTNMKGITKKLVAALIELIHFLFSGALMTGLLGKMFILLGMTELGMYCVGGAWVVWAVVAALGHSDEKGTSRVLAGLIKLMDPGADLGMVRGREQPEG